MRGGVVVNELKCIPGYDAWFGRGAFDGEFLLVESSHFWAIVKVVVQRDGHPPLQDG